MVGLVVVGFADDDDPALRRLSDHPVEGNCRPVLQSHNITVLATRQERDCRGHVLASEVD